MHTLLLSESGSASRRAGMPLSWLALALVVAGMLLGGVQTAAAGPGACVDPSECYGLQCGQYGWVNCVPDGACHPQVRKSFCENDYWYYGCICYYYNCFDEC